MLSIIKFFENIDFIFIRCNRNNKIDHCNPFSTHITAFTSADLLGKNLLSFFHPDEHKAVTQALTQNDVNSTYHTHRFIKADGSFFWIKWQLTVDEAQGDYYVIGEDVSESKRVSSALSALESVTDTGYWEIDLDTGYLYWSDYVHRIHETDAATFRPKLEDGLKFFPPDAISTLTDVLQKLEQTGEPYSVDLNFISSKGKNLIVNATGFSEVINGRVVRNFGTFKDLTMQKEDEMTRQGLEQRVVLALQAAQIGVWDYDIVGDRLVWDDRLFEIYGRSRDSFNGILQDWNDSVYPDDLAEAQNAFLDSITNHKYFKHEFRVVTNSGDIRSVLGMAACIYDANNNPIKATGVNIDLTEANQIKDELKAISERAQNNAQLAEKMAEKAKAADIQKSAFLANVSHEIRTPISGVIGLVDMLIEDAAMKAVSDEKRQHYLGLIKNSSKHLLNIITDILDFSKIEAGKISISSQQFNLTKLVGELIDDFAHRATEKGLKFDYQSVGMENALCTGDPHRLRQILYNLLGNAIKFTTAGKISVRARLNKKADGNANFICAIIDTGIGIKEDSQGTLFEAFEQVDSSATRRAQGTGLGLPISRKLVELMGGSVKVDSEFGVGSNFTINVPFGSIEKSNVSYSAMTNAETDDINYQAFENCHALVAEDNEINQVVIQNLLDQLKIKCTLAADGEEALEYLHSDEGAQYNFILMDCQMPKLDGFETTRMIREDDKYQKVKNIPIIALTANAMKSDKEKCLRAGMNGYLAKPVTKALLSASIIELLQASRSSN
ncbi:PAS domain-containing hybrid sensor histidine kinase/response regulator [Brumicola nitratireducens]|uniref:histidine kinase n=1 Tax=Glaciecola nitratireducens (strain JCM 12485 / KCTC 12276 / FR1064) TaxID=1085623 RepID=G4QGA4_GLANF|nr:PAS domain-containing protein [Glaciecola nitratireducens]AEP29429.1 multi-sensor hybrid histidine kinase [Glaciecola nitratireducens FR1064]